MKNAYCVALLLFAVGCEPYHVAAGVDPTLANANANGGVKGVAPPSSVAGGHPPAGQAPAGQVMDPNSAATRTSLGSPGMQAGASPVAAGPVDIITGQIDFAESEDTLAQGQFISSFSTTELPLMWIRVTVSDMPDVALLHLSFIDGQGTTFHRESAWFGVASTVGSGTGQVVYLASAVGTGYALDEQPTFPSAGPAPTPGDWRVEATLDGYAGTITAALTVQ